MSETEQTFAQHGAGPAARARDGSASLIGVAFFGALTYATLRYNIFKGVPWTDWPSYTLNKAFGFASLILIAMSVIRMGKRLQTSKIMMSASALGLAHSLLSLALLNPLYYAKFYESGKLTALAGLGITLGAAAAAAMNGDIRRSQDWEPSRRQVALALVALTVGLHAALPAFSNWVEPETWPGRMPPITLLSFLCGVGAIGYWARSPRGTASMSPSRQRFLFQNARISFADTKSGAVRLPPEGDRCPGMEAAGAGQFSSVQAARMRPLRIRRR